MVWVAIGGKIQILIGALGQTTVPGWPSLGSNSSSGGERKLFRWVK
jgi:hypothetical protein